ncbi:MAG TPA: phospholipase D-like domain-containing protein [Herpetosiphonaceae bacterium]|nr:phospholipase D-like domain-containing protein [Herpetosiphonaceae bacterium]
MALDIVLWAFCAVVLAQLAVSTILVSTDLLRKRRRAPTAFPWLSLDPAKVEGNELRLYTYGEELYADMLAAIQHAERQVLFETFIWKDDAVGQDFKQRLTGAAARGVEVYIVYDSFANLVVPWRFKHFPKELRVLRYPVLPRIWQLLDPRRYARDHRKILVVDGQTAFVGGFNIGARYAMEWRDTHLRLAGPVVVELQNAFVDFWNTHRSRALPVLPNPEGRVWESAIRIYRNDPTALSFPIRTMYLEAIDRAAHHIHLTHGYFIPDRALFLALLDAARRGVDVRILLPERSNHIVVDWLARGFYGRCLRGGIHLLLYQNAMIHAKTATIDSVWSTVGTANMDRLSLVGNFEINLEIYSEQLAQQMERIFARDITNARELTLEAWRSRPWFAKVGETVLLPLRPLL